MVHLLNCLDCHDLVKLRRRGPRSCKCGKSFGQYNIDGTLEKSGPARIVSIDATINDTNFQSAGIEPSTDDIVLRLYES